MVFSKYNDKTGKWSLHRVSEIPVGCRVIMILYNNLLMNDARVFFIVRIEKEVIVMGQRKKIGVILILTGLCIPMLSMIFASNYNPERGLILNIQKTIIVLWERTYIVDAKPQHPPDLALQSKPKPTRGETVTLDSIAFDPIKIKETIYVPLSLSFGLGIILTAIGAGLVIISKNVRGNSSPE
jgi:hypothetical protein